MPTATTKSPTTPRKTTTRKTTAAKPAMSQAAEAKTTAQTSSPIKVVPDLVPETKPHVVTATKPVVTEPDLKKKELIEQVVARSGIKKKDAKPVVEAMLAVLGETLAEGRELNLAPMGKLRINRTQEHNNGRVIICKLRQPLASDKNPAPSPLAKSED